LLIDLFGYEDAFVLLFGTSLGPGSLGTPNQYLWMFGDFLRENPDFCI